MELLGPSVTDTYTRALMSTGQVRAAGASNGRWGRSRCAHVALAAAALLAACNRAGSPDAPLVTAASPSAGQVAAAAAPKVSFYAASRFAEQATFGPTPALVAELQAKGFEQWIDEQLAMAISPIDPTPVNYTGRDDTNADHEYAGKQFAQRVLTSPAQLKMRVAHAIEQFIVLGRGANYPIGYVGWHNLMFVHGTGHYRDLLRAVSRDPSMGSYLNNVENRPKSGACPTCAPNENFARELMQLFALGTFRVKLDGSPLRDARGSRVETYTQADVAELARALTGWTFDLVAPASGTEPIRYATPLVPSTLATERDAGAKTLLGRTLPAGQGAARELDDIVELLVQHPNAAPFVALRMIQHLVSSNPTPAYIERVARAFRDNGHGVAGDMQAVVRAVLLDPEARAGDTPGANPRHAGKYREPYLWTYAILRAMGCRTPPLWPDGVGRISTEQEPGSAPTVFGWYAPTDRSPGTTLVAPEQGLITSEVLKQRSSYLERTADEIKVAGGQTSLEQAGCDLPRFVAAYQAGPTAFADLLSMRFFRGAMSPALRREIAPIMRYSEFPQLNRSVRWQMGHALSNILNMPYYGVMQ